MGQRSVEDGQNIKRKKNRIHLHRTRYLHRCKTLDSGLPPCLVGLERRVATKVRGHHHGRFTTHPWKRRAARNRKHTMLHYRSTC